MLLVSLLAAPVLARAEAALGAWFTDSKDMEIAVYKCGDKLCGKITWMQQHTEANGQPKRDVKNPDPRLRTQPVVGVVLMRDFAYAGDNVWEGDSLYNGRSGKTYSCKLTVVDKNKLDVRPFVGFSLLGKTIT